MLKRLAFAATFALLLAACSDPSLPVDARVRARAVGDATLAITNRGGEPVYFHVLDPTRLAIFIGCAPETCPRILPGETVHVPYSAIVSYEPGSTTALVDWSTFERRPDGSYRQTGSGSVPVEL
jgi:hypothetical protein